LKKIMNRTGKRIGVRADWKEFTEITMQMEAMNDELIKKVAGFARCDQRSPLRVSAKPVACHE